MTRVRRSLPRAPARRLRTELWLSSASLTPRGPRRSRAFSRSSSPRCDTRGDRGPPCGVPSSVGLTKPPSRTPACRNPRIRCHPRVSCRLLARVPLRVSWVTRSQTCSRSRSPTPRSPSAISGWACAPAWGAARWGRTPSRWAEHDASHGACRPCTLACWMTRARPVGRPRVLTPPSGVALSTRVTGCGVYVPLRRGSRMDGHWCVRDCGHSPTVLPSMPGLPWVAFPLCRALFRCSRATISSLTRSSLTGRSVRSVALEASVPCVAAVGGSPLRSAAQARLTWCFCGVAPMTPPAS